MSGFSETRPLLCAALPLLGASPVLQAQADSAEKVIATPDAPEAIGPYSKAIRVGKTVFLAGQIPIGPKTKKLLADASIEEQTWLVLENLKAVRSRTDSRWRTWSPPPCS